ncbi:retropepsin-like aspartic protease [Bradyrhizobium sp. G127]|uniref:retropepsin-like aspartic protease n=1 Tax=Bradyrhizobium sp. G127 TaxID=2904800 RepID=UPI001F32B28F|nr:retropepsin-like aspartic protease [Bradyrhizobium sp. G127]MCF2525415.1 retroviral-like aspartic protease family protein [Bradyrhizobium sp. G127]
MNESRELPPSDVGRDSNDTARHVDRHSRPERLAPNYDAGGSSFVTVAIAVSVILAIAVGAYAYVVTSPVPAVLAPVKTALTPAPPPSRYQAVYEQFGVATLPADFDRKNPKIVRYLDQFSREPCDSSAILPLMRILDEAGYPREAAKSGHSFSTRCQFYNDVIGATFAYYEQINDHTSALAIANDAVKEDEARGRYRFFRGTAYEGLKNYKAALSDYISTLQLFTDLSNVALSEFYRVSRMYVAVGRPCDAITPLEMYLSYDVQKRQTAQITRLISDYAKAGNCQATYANGGDRIIVGPNNIVDVTINGARGRMIVDTGATSIAITPSFAARARIVPDEQNMITAYVVGGTVKQAPGYAQLVQVGTTTASNVPLTISTGNDTAFGPQLDGLLGMTFLARFTASLSGGVLELKPRPLN